MNLRLVDLEQEDGDGNSLVEKQPGVEVADGHLEDIPSRGEVLILTMFSSP
jgi:hypothetical protein